MLKPKIGEFVRLSPLRVVAVEADYICCYGGYSFGFDAIEEILPQPLAVGDRVGVKSNPHHESGEIAAIRDGEAWVFWFSGGSRIVWLSDLIRAEPA